jgi:pyruvate kinase
MSEKDKNTITTHEQIFKPGVKFSLNPSMSEKDKNTLKIGLHRAAVTFKA